MQSNWECACAFNPDINFPIDLLKSPAILPLNLFLDLSYFWSLYFTNPDVNDAIDISQVTNCSFKKMFHGFLWNLRSFA